MLLPDHPVHFSFEDVRIAMMFMRFVISWPLVINNYCSNAKKILFTKPQS